MMRALVFAFVSLALPARAEPTLQAMHAFEGCWTGAFAGNGDLRDDRCFM